LHTKPRLVFHKSAESWKNPSVRFIAAYQVLPDAAVKQVMNKSESRVS